MQATNFTVYPVAGQVVNVMHKSALNAAGLAGLKKAEREVRTIKQVHIIEGGFPTITDHVGDVWSVKPAKLNEWDTVDPAHH